MNSVFKLYCYAETEQSIFDAILRGHIDFSSDPWPNISSSAKDIVKKMMCADPKERLSAAEVLSKFLIPKKTLQTLADLLYSQIFARFLTG